jgi:hypothetical protein
MIKRPSLAGQQHKISLQQPAHTPLHSNHGIDSNTIRDSMQYYRVWIYSCNSVLGVTSAIFTVFAAFVLADVRLSLLRLVPTCAFLFKRTKRHIHVIPLKQLNFIAVNRNPVIFGIHTAFNLHSILAFLSCNFLIEVL